MNAIASNYSDRLGEPDKRVPGILSARPAVYLGLMVICFILLKPLLIGPQFPMVGALIKGLAVPVFLGMVWVYQLRHIKVSSVLVLFVVYRLVFLFPTFVYDGDLLNWGFVSIGQLSLLMFIEIRSGMGVEENRRLLRVIADLLLIYLIINYWMIVTDNGFTTRLGTDFGQQTTYLLGIRTRVSDCIFPAIMVSLLHDAMSNVKIGLRTILIIVFGVLQVVELHVATALVGFGVALAFYLIMRIFKIDRGLFTMRGVTIAGLTLNVLIVVFRIHYRMADFITNVLEKSVELTGRTVIWDNATPILLDSPLIGYGIDRQFGAFVPWEGGILWQAHNQYLQIMHDGGLIAVALFIALLFLCGRPVDRLEKGKYIKTKAAFVSIYAAFSVMSVSEIFTYNMGMIFVVLFLASRAGTLIPQSEQSASESEEQPEVSVLAQH